MIKPVEEMQSENKTKESVRIYERTHDELVEKQDSNSENLDKSILTLASSGLGLTITFISNVVNLSNADYILLLIGAWCFFGISIVSTIISFLVSQKGIRVQLEYAKKYYLENKEDYLTKKNSFKESVNKINFISTSTFLLGIIFLIIFVSINIVKVNNMNDQQKNKTSLNEGKEINNLQKVIKTDITKGQVINNMQPITSGSNIPKTTQDSGSQKENNK